MKLRHLELENYGIHEQQTFDFGENGLHVIHGRNEAGKSTLLQAVRELLFGFRRQNPYAPDSTKKKMKAAATLRLAEGQELEITRRQTKNALTGQFLDDSETIDDARWRELLTGADQQLYEHVFGFALKELATGEESLKEANINEALFGGGLGRLHDYKQLLSDIEEETQKLFKSRGQKQEINHLLAQIKDLKSELKESSLKPAQYEEWLTQANRCEGELQRLEQALEKAFRRQRHLDRLKKGYPAWIARKALLKRLAELEAPESFPQDALDDLKQTRRLLVDVSAKIQQIETNLTSSDQEIAGIHYNEALLDRAEEIRRLTQEISRIRGFRRDLPLRKQERQDELDKAEEILRQLDPKLRLDQIEQFQLAQTQRNGIKRLLKQYQKLRTELESHGTDVDRLDRDIRTFETQLQQLPAEDVAGMERLDACLIPFREAVGRQAELEQQIRQMQGELDQRRALLLPCTETPLDLDRPLPVPLEETLRRYQSDFDSIAADQKQADRARQETVEGLSSKRDELRQLEQGVRLVSREELAQVRSQRDASWTTLRSILFGEQTAPSQPQLRTQADEYQRQLETSDAMADQRHDSAQTLAKQESLQGEVRHLEERLEHRTERCQNLEQRREQLWQTWLAEWAPCGITPKLPSEMADWRTRYLDLVARHGEIARKREELAPHARRIDETLKLVEAHDAPVPLAPREAIAWMEKALRQAEEQRKRHGELQVKLQSQQDHRQSLVEQNEKRLAQLEAIQAEATELLAVFQTLGKVDVETAAELIQAIDEVHGKLASSKTLQKRIGDMEQGLAEFHDQVQAVVAATGEPLKELPPEDAAVRLGDLVTEAENRRGRRKELEASRREQQQTHAARIAEQADLEKRLAQWRTQVAVENDEELELVSQTVREKLSLEREVAQLDQQLALIRESEEPEVFAAALDTLDNDRLELDLAAATQEHQEIQSQMAEANKQLGLLQHQLSEVDQTSRAVVAQGKIEALQAQLSEHLDRLGPLLVAREMLDRAMSAFSEQNSGQLLTMISELLERMTGGRYVRVEHDLDEGGQLILVGADDERRTPSQLSTGTREQLYLAIRLAYIRHYCQTAEPLPVLMDDILVNFDDERQEATLKVLVDFDPRIQIILLTCHKPLVDKVKKLKGEVRVSQMDGTPVASPKPSVKEKPKTPSLFENV